MTEIKFWISEEDFPDDWEEEGIDVVALTEAVKNMDCDITVVPQIGSRINIIVLDCWLEFGVKDYTYYFADRVNGLWSEEASGKSKVFVNLYFSHCMDGKLPKINEKEK